MTQRIRRIIHTGLVLAGLVGLTLLGFALLYPGPMGLGSNEYLRMRENNVAAVASALKAYAHTHGHRFPASAAEANKALLSPGAGLLPDDKLLPSPYGGTQRELLPLMGPLGSVADPTPNGERFSGGHQSDAIQSWEHLGALLYDASPDGNQFVLYGVMHGSVAESFQPWSFRKLIFRNHRVLTATASIASLEGYEEDIHAYRLKLEWQRASREAQYPYVAMPVKGLPFLFR